MCKQIEGIPVKTKWVASDLTIVGDDADVAVHASVDPNQDNQATEDDDRKVWRAVAVTYDRSFLLCFLSPPDISWN